MRMTALLLIVALLNVHAAGSAQSVTLSGKDVSLAKVFPIIKKQTGFVVFGNIEFLHNSKKVSFDVSDMPLRDFLDLLLKEQPFTYKISGKTISLYEKPVENTATAIDIALIKSITGSVYANDGTPLQNVSVRVKNSKGGVRSNEKGIFTINNVADNETLIVTSIGYEDLEIPLQAYVNPSAENKVRGVSGRINNGILELKIVLQLKVAQLDETIITTGYGNYKKGAYTGAATTVLAKDIMLSGVSTIDQMLEGAIPGLYVNTPTGQVGASSKLRVRGTSTLLGSQEPVWVVDGVIQVNPNTYENTNFTTNEDDIRQLAGTAISWLNPYDIESITVLRDASATAIYGSKAANGVIVITTKKATQGKTTINYSGELTTGQKPHYGLYKQMNSAELMEYNRQNYDDRAPFRSGIIRQGYAGLVYQMINREITLEEMNRQYQKMAAQNTDYFGALFRNAVSQRHSVSISGGSEFLQNRTSFSFDNQLGEATGNNLRNFNATNNTTLRLSRKITLDLNLNGTYRKVDGFAYGVTPFSYAYNTARIYPLYNEDGSYFYYLKAGSTSTAVANLTNYNYNILNERDNTGSGNKTWTWNASLNARWKILPSLEYQGTYSFASSAARTDQWATELSNYITNIRGYEYGSVSPSGTAFLSSRLPSGGFYQYTTSTVNSITMRNALVFNKLFRQLHQLIVTGGLETRSSSTDNFSQDRYGYLKYRGNTFASPPLTYYQLGSTNSTTNAAYAIGTTTISGSLNNYLSEYGQAVYSYDNRYTINATARLDASNRFGQFNNRRFSPVWSLGGKWRIANEKFMKEHFPWLDMADLYGSYGFQGQAVESISPYLTAINLGTQSGYNVNGMRVNKLPFPDLGWQKTSTWNIGLDLSFLGNRIMFTGNIYKKTSHVYNTQAIPYENGSSSDVVSGSTIENTGYEANLQIIPVKTSRFIWTFGINSAINHNRIRATSHQDTYLDMLNGKANIPGDPYSTFYSYDFAGLDPLTGQPLFNRIDINKPATAYKTSLDYLVVSGQMIPYLSGGLSNTFRYKKLTLNMLFSYQVGAGSRLPALYTYTSMAGTPDAMDNVNRDLFNRWRKPGDEKVPGILPSVPGISNSSNQVDIGQISNISQGGGSRYRSRYELYAFSSERVASSDMLRCRAITIGYDLGENFMKRGIVKYMTIKASMTNPFMWVKDKRWDGLDPSTGDWPARRTTSLTVQMSL